METLLPCPFCGSSEGLEYHEGTTFRWRDAYCLHCGASPGEIRHDTLATNQIEAENESRIRLNEAWNTRASADAAHRAREEAVREAELALTEARNTFRSYAQMHMDKGTVAGAEKAIYNQLMSETMDKALAALTHPAHSDAGAGSGYHNHEEK